MMMNNDYHDPLDHIKKDESIYDYGNDVRDTGDDVYGRDGVSNVGSVRLILPNF